MVNFPRQRISYSQKISSNYKWARDVMDHLLLNYTLESSGSNEYKNDYHRKLANYQLFNNQINQQDFRVRCRAISRCNTTL
jgi:hypothetical protein